MALYIRFLCFLLTVTMLVGVGEAQIPIPACPVGSQAEQWKAEGRPYVHHRCKLPQKSNNMEMCREWEGTHWSTDGVVPCGSRVSSDVEYIGELKCPISEQVILWDSSTNAPSKDISCLPPGWAGTPMRGSACSAGYVSGSPALFGQDMCYGPRTALLQHDLLAHDINGFTLDMTIRQVQQLAHNPLHSLGRGQYQVTVNGVNYDFGFSVLGHLYRIDSSQIFGRFIPDEAYASSLTKKLTTKFGPPQTNQLPSGPAFWEYFEKYRAEAGGPLLNRTTVSLTAMLTGVYGQPVGLQLKLMDFRIMRRDITKANATPRSQAEDATKF